MPATGEGVSRPCWGAPEMGAHGRFTAGWRMGSKTGGVWVLKNDMAAPARRWPSTPKADSQAARWSAFSQACGGRCGEAPSVRAGAHRNIGKKREGRSWTRVLVSF